jgi:hypothetical protein
MDTKTRYNIVPQMSDYDRVGESWNLYLMKTDTVNVKFSSVTTDQYGLRKTLTSKGEIVDNFPAPSNSDDGSLGIVLGGSTVFGVGATADQCTIPSFLNKTTETTWLNYGSRTYNSTQEQIRFSLLLPQKLNKLIIYSGVNNLTLAFVSSSASPIYNALFYQSQYEAKMKAPVADNIGIRWSLRILFEAIKKKIGKEEKKVQFTLGRKYDSILSSFRRDLRVLQALCASLEAEVYFVMQPLATWIDRKLSKEESEIFPVLDSLGSDWKVLADFLGAQKNRYFNDIESICDELQVPFYNMNLSKEFSTDEWLFVDRVHLTDRGYELSSKVLKEVFKL